VLGAGGIARRFVKDLQEFGAGTVIAVGSRDAARAEAFGAELGIAHHHGSYESLVEDGDVDVIYVATVHPTHHAGAMLALEHDKAVLVEKPFTMNAEEARQLVATARARKLFLMEAMWPRFLPHFAALREVIAGGSLGEIVAVQADHGQWFASDPTHRLFAPELGGGARLDLGIYPVSFASFVLGKPSRVSVEVTPAFTGVDGQTSMLFSYPSGAQAQLTCCLFARTPNRAVVVGTQAHADVAGTFYVPGSFDIVARDRTRTRVEPPHEGFGLWYEAAEVERCLETGLLESPLLPLDETVSIMETMDEVAAASAARLAAG
jgi:predicted dehydrogenase